MEQWFSPLRFFPSLSTIVCDFLFFDSIVYPFILRENTLATNITVEECTQIAEDDRRQRGHVKECFDLVSVSNDIWEKFCNSLEKTKSIGNSIFFGWLQWAQDSAQKLLHNFKAIHKAIASRLIVWHPSIVSWMICNMPCKCFSVHYSNASNVDANVRWFWRGFPEAMELQFSIYPPLARQFNAIMYRLKLLVFVIIAEWWK